MNEMYIISFNSTHQAIKCDKAFGKNEIDYTVLPTPREISQSCGMSIRFGLEDIDTIKEIIDQNQIEYKSMYRIFKEDGKKQVEEIVSKLLKENDYIVAENLQVNKIITESSSKSLRKNIIHSTFSLILTKLRQKCLWENKRFIQVNTYFPSSQLCSCCGHRNKEMKDLKLREYKCSECGNILDRDINASLNVLNEGIKMAFGL